MPACRTTIAMLFGLLLPAAAFGERLTGQIPFRHPLLGAAINETPAPIIESQDSPSGNRYAISEGIWSDFEGDEHTYSGIREYHSRSMEVDELNLLMAEKLMTTEASKTNYQRNDSVLGRAIREQLELALEQDLFNVMLCVNRSTHFRSSMDTAIAYGSIDTMDDYYLLRSLFIKEDAEKTSELLLALSESVEGYVFAKLPSIGCMSLLVDSVGIDNLARSGLIKSIELNGSLDDNANVNGYDVLIGTQISQFSISGWDGEMGSGSADDINFAMIETGAPLTNHHGFKEDSGSTNRIRQKFICSSGSCLPTNNFSTASMHATNIAGIIFGDLMDGQDLNYPIDIERQKRSGYAREARAYLYQAPTDDDMAAALESAVDVSPYPSVINMSAGGNFDPFCEGRSPMSSAANQAYEYDILLIKSAGNVNNGPSDCTVSDPGSAISVFTVASHGDGFLGTSADVKTDPISASSSYGGDEIYLSEGRGRSIIAATAFGYRDLLFDYDGGYTGISNGTSISTAVVTASAIDFIDFYRSFFGNFIDSPGVLHTILLLMGDREAGTYHNGARFSQRWGAGRILMRAFDGPGMDSPYGFDVGSVCIGQNDVVTVPIHDSVPIPTGADYFKATAYWYDPRHEAGLQIADIDLRIWQDDSVVLSASIDDYDNKERVYTKVVAGRRLFLRFYGMFVPTGRDIGCGTTKMKVFYSYMYEDSARDDADGPDSSIWPDMN